MSGFKKGITAKANAKGELYLHVLNPSDHHQCGHITVTAQTIKDINENLMSVSDMVKQHGFSFILQPNGYEGFYKHDQAGGKTMFLPTPYDPVRKLWFMHFAISGNEPAAIETTNKYLDHMSTRDISNARALLIRDQTSGEDTPTTDLLTTGVPMNEYQVRQLRRHIQDSGDAQLITSMELPWPHSNGEAYYGGLSWNHTQLVGDDLNTTNTPHAEWCVHYPTDIRTTRTCPTTGKERLRAEASTTELAMPATNVSNSPRWTTSDTKLVDLENTDTHKLDDASVVPSQRPRDKRLTQRERHEKLGHIGPCPGGCDICKQCTGNLRPVFAQATPVYDTRPGITCSMDSMYVDITSHQGNNYAVPMRDEGAGFFTGFFMSLRSEAPEATVNCILTIRRDPQLRCPHFCQRLRIDPAGEWGPDYKKFQDMMKDIGVEVIQPPGKSDHRLLHHGENAVFITKMHAQKMMLGTRLETNMWEACIKHCWWLRNRHCLKRDMSPNGRGIRPLTAISNNNIDAEECDRQLEYSWPPGTLMMVHNPYGGKHGGFKDITKVRFGRVLRMERDVIVCETLGKRNTLIRTKNASAIPLRPGLSALDWAGIKLKKHQLPTAMLPGQGEAVPAMTTVLQLSTLYTHGKPTRLPIVANLHNNDDALMPNVTVTDTSGRIWQPSKKDGYLQPTDGWIDRVSPQQATVDDNHRRFARQIDLLETDPESFINCEIHRNWPDYGGVLRGKVIDYDADDNLWGVTYEVDDVQCDFDHTEMERYAIKRVDGESPADGGRSAYSSAIIKRSQHAHVQGDESHMQNCHTPSNTAEPSSPGDAPDAGDVPASSNGQPTNPAYEYYTTLNNQTFDDVCTAIKVLDKTTYFNWLKDHHNMGNCREYRNNTTNKWSLYFPNPIHNAGNKRKKKKNQTRFNKGVLFPYATGTYWNQYVRQQEALRVGDEDSTDNNVLAAIATTEIAMMEHENAKLTTTTGNEWTNLLMLRKLQHVLRHDMRDTTEICWAALDEAEYTDKRTGLPIPPKSTKELSKRTAHSQALWNPVIDKEWNGLNDRNCFEHDQTITQLKQRGLIPAKKIIPMRMLMTTKVDSTGNIDKLKARNIVTGHKAYVRPGIDYDTVFAAAPNIQATRLLQIIAVTFNFVRFAYDITAAYLSGTAREDQRFPVRYPEGKIRDQHRDPHTGEERYAILIGNLYGLPQSARVWAQYRDDVYLNKLPETYPGWKVERMMYEQCMFKFTSPKGKVSFKVIHTDDADGISEDPDDAVALAKMANELFMHKGKDGIVVGDPKHMLGISREITVQPDGVRILRITMTGYIEKLWDSFGKFRTGRKTPSMPFPQGKEAHPLMDEAGKIPDITDDEAKRIHNLGYRELLGGLLWLARNVGIGIAYAVSILSRCMHRPSAIAWEAALHTLHYAYHRREEGIVFRSDGNLAPICFYDSGHSQNLITHKSQYGFIVYWGGGPAVWKSKRHDHVGLHSSEDEYMALSHAFRQVAGMRHLLVDMGYGHLVKAPTPMIGDNRNATSWGREQMITDGNRHIDRMYMKVGEATREGTIIPIWIKGQSNPSDFLTKAIEKIVDDTLRLIVCGLQPFELPSDFARQMADCAVKMNWDYIPDRYVLRQSKGQRDSIDKTRALYAQIFAAVADGTQQW